VTTTEAPFSLNESEVSIASSSTDLCRVSPLAQALREARNRFVATTFHELRCQLAGIQTSIDVLQRYQDRLDEPSRESRYRQVGIYIQQMDQLLRDITTLVVLFGQDWDASVEEVELSQLCHTVIQEANLRTGGSHTFEFVDDNTAPALSTVADLLKAMLHELLENAVRYSATGTRITVSLQHDNTSTVITVRDEGLGIPGESITRLGEPFYRAPNAEHTPGTGLGMTICKEIVSLLEGKLEIESAVGFGTTVRVCLEHPSKNRPA
jgi:signal transduction histidine kinase